MRAIRHTCKPRKPRKLVDMAEIRLSDRQTSPASERRAQLVQIAEDLADGLFNESESRTSAAPLASLDRLRTAGLLRAPLRNELGGLGLGVEPGSQLALLRVLAALGGGDLAVGRIYEGHVNALMLVQAYGSPDRIEAAAEDARAGMLFGVWNTGDPEPMRLEQRGNALALQGRKTFATGAAFVQRPIVPAEHHGWQMTMPRMESHAVASAIKLDRTSWEPMGMESSESLTIDFTGAQIEERDLLGKPGDFYRDPLFRGGAIRFAAVQTGAVVRLAQSFADWLTSRGRQSDPYQVARLGQVELLAQEAVLWIERAAEAAESCMMIPCSEAETKRMVRFANMTRLGVQHAATAIMAHVVAGVGAHGLLRPARFERIIRDLTMYLRQANADGTLADVGRSALLEDTAGYWTNSGTSSRL